MTQTITLIALLLLMALMGVYNGQFISWERATFNKKAKWSKAWHRTGFIIRFLIFLVAYLNLGIGWALASGVLAWPIYNMIIARYMGMSTFYIGATSFLDRAISPWVTYALYTILLAFTLVFIIK